ncbi:MAG: hypothetical protein M1814_002076 [Vezdaea aestivalis]|nr:MAG: hypothetical protein M1814_002076 [Vezdaea aestivalis]
MASLLEASLYTVVGVLLVILSSGANAAPGDLCSNFNTGADFQSSSNIWQSHGACSLTCGDKYAYAILQGKSCWCSNYAPSTTNSNGDCNKGCPGFPQEKCGDESSGLFGYVALGPAPSGTRGVSSSQPSQSSTASSIVTGVQSTATSDPPTTSSTWVPTPYTTVRTVTGGVQTVTLTPTEPPATITPRPSAIFSSSLPSKNSSSLSGGAIAGIVIGILVAVGLAVGLLLVLCLRKRRNDDVSRDGSVGSRSPPRSRGSLSGLINSVTGENNKPMAEANPEIQVWPAKPTYDRQPSHDYIRFDKDHKPRLVDQRLDPRSLWGRTETGSSRTSVRSFRDDQDYSRRVLQLTNPDA